MRPISHWLDHAVHRVDICHKIVPQRMGKDGDGDGMTANFKRIFGEKKPAIAMVHLGALPGTPLYDDQAGIDGLIEGARRDLNALQAAGFDAVMFGNENDRPYQFSVDVASTATMAFVIGVLRSEIKVPFGVNVLWDPKEFGGCRSRHRSLVCPRDHDGSLRLGYGPLESGRRCRFSLSQLSRAA